MIVALLAVALCLAMVVVTMIQAGRRFIAERVAELVTDAHQADCAGCCAVCQAPRHNASCLVDR